MRDKAKEWAEDAAETLIEDFDDATSIDTADYQLCGFILAAARIARDDPEFARRIGKLMEPQRTGVR